MLVWVFLVSGDVVVDVGGRELEQHLHSLKHLVMENVLGMGREGRLQVANSMMYLCLQTVVCFCVCGVVLCEQVIWRVDMVPVCSSSPSSTTFPSMVVKCLLGWA